MIVSIEYGIVMIIIVYDDSATARERSVLSTANLQKSRVLPT